MNSQPRTDYVTHQTRHAERGNNRPMGLLPTVSRQFLDWVRNRVRVRVRVRLGSGLGLGLEWRSRNCHVTVAHIGVCGVM